MRITKELLFEYGACTYQVDTFIALFPHGARVTFLNALKAARGNLDLGWLIDVDLGNKQREAYEKAIKSAGEAYFKALKLAREVYLKAVRPVGGAYFKAIRPAREVYLKVIARAFCDVYKEG